MANQTNTAKKPQKEPKFLLGSLFVDADVAVEPEEPAKIVVAGMAEARIKKDYPDGYFRKAAAVVRGDFATLLKSSLWFMPAALIFMLTLLVVPVFFEPYVMGTGWNFMMGVGIIGGVLGAGDSVSASVAMLYWDVYQPVLMMLAAAAIIVTPFMAGLFYCAKRSYYQDFYKRTTRTFFMGFAKYWWKFLLVGTVGILVMLGMATALMNQLTLQQLGTDTAGSMAAVVLSFIFGAPLLTLPMVMLSLFTTYGLSLKDAFKDSLVLIANNPFTVIITGILSLAPLLLLLLGTIFSVIICVAMLIVGFIFWSLCWVALADRGMTKCKALKAYTDKQKLISIRRQNGGAKAQKGAGRVNASRSAAPAGGGNKTSVQGGGRPAAADGGKKKQPPKPYQNPKKKKKK